MMRADTLRDHLARLRRLTPHRDSATGMLYRDRSELRGFYRKVTMTCLFVSDDETFSIREHIFEAKKLARSSMQWAEWFREHHQKIIDESILPGIARRTGGAFWLLYKIIGWRPDARTRVAVPALVKRQRHKAKRKRRPRGRAHIRRR